jgi:hypothetical protein
VAEEQLACRDRLDELDRHLLAAAVGLDERRRVLDLDHARGDRDVTAGQAALGLDRHASALACSSRSSCS